MNDVDRNLNILLIEDDDDHAELLHRCIAASGGTNTTLHRARDLKAATPMFSDAHADIIVVDLGLPETQGLTTLEAVLELSRATPVIVLTATDDEELGSRAIRMGAQDYICKVDLNPRVIARSVGYAMERTELLTKLRTTNSVLSTFASDAAHDLRSPLRRILRYVELIEGELEGQLSNRARGYLSHVSVASGRLWNMVDSLLEFSASRSGGTAHEACRLDGVVAEAIEQLQVEIEECGARISASDLAHSTVGNRALLVQVMQNLVGNAIKYVEGRRPSVHISARVEGGEIEVSVQDNGIGIKEENWEAIFQPLQRLHSADEYEGSGVGLAICRRVIDAHGGRLWVRSTPSEGSTFYFRIPAG